MKIICDWKNCKEIGSYKAPVERDNSKKYRLLCLEHIKIFNKSWNYFENMDDQQIEYFIKSDLTWHKSTKKFGSSENFFNILWNNALDDKLNIFSSFFYGFSYFISAVTYIAYYSASCCIKYFLSFFGVKVWPFRPDHFHAPALF